MPLARGMMIMNRLDVYSTATTMTITEIPPYTHGQTIHFNVAVTNLTDPGITPNAGMVNIYDLNSSTVLGSAALGYGGVTVPVTLSFGSFNIIAQYLGTNTGTLFDPSISATSVMIGIATRYTSTSIIFPPSLFYFCADGYASISAEVTSGVGTPTGNIQFNYYYLGTTTNLGSLVPLSGGIASFDGYLGVPGTSGGTQLWVGAVYGGGGGYSPSASPGGFLGTPIYAVANQSTSISFTNVFPTTIDIADHIDVTVGVISSSHAGNPSNGTVTLVGYQLSGSYIYPPGYILGSGTPLDGYIDFNSVMFPALGTSAWYLRAFYNDPSGCYSNIMTAGGADGYFIETYEE